MADSVYVLGDVVFGLAGAGMTTSTRSRAWRHVTAGELDVLPTPAFIGAGDDSITLEGVVFPGQAGEAASVERLGELGDAGDPLPLVDGDGHAYGRWVILGLEESRSVFFGGGTPRRIGWRLRLQRYPDGS